MFSRIHRHRESVQPIPPTAEQLAELPVLSGEMWAALRRVRSLGLYDREDWKGDVEYARQNILRHASGYLNSGEHSVVVTTANPAIVFACRYDSGSDALTQNEWRFLSARHTLANLMAPKHFPPLLGALVRDDTHPDTLITGTFRTRVFGTDRPVQHPIKDALGVFERHNIPLALDFVSRGGGNFMRYLADDGQVYAAYVDELEPVWEPDGRGFQRTVKWSKSDVLAVLAEQGIALTEGMDETIDNCLEILGTVSE